jgi:type IV secretory pathway TraG/TraD family ATPase VirD4
MTRAIGPNVGLGRDAAVPFAILGLCWVPVMAVGVIWLAGHAGSWISGHGWAGPEFGFDFAGALVDGGVQAAWPETAPEIVWSLAGALVLAVASLTGLIAVRIAGSRPDPGDPLSSLATAADLEALTPAGAAARAVRLRPNLEQKSRRDPDPRDTGVELGHLRSGRRGSISLRASWEDVVLAVMAPRAGKTTALAVPAILEAPGAVVATSNKADLWAATSTLRQRDTTEPVWEFDPQHIVGVERSWWWNPLRGVTDVEEAHRLAGHFVQEVRGGRSQRDFWTSAAHDLLTGLIRAAALSRQSLVEVYEWLNDPVLTTPAQILREHGERAAAASLSGRQNGAPETRDGVYETARTAAQCLRDGAIMAWVTPSSRGADGRDVVEFDAAAFPRTRQSLYLLSKDGAGAAAPLVAALTDRVMREATRTAERAGGRLDPPMVVVLDEAANVCRISDLPELYSHLGSRGVVPVTILQSYRQGTRVWGDHGMDALWSAATCKVIGAGLDDARLAENISRLVGDHDVPVRSVSRGDGRATESVSLRRQRILPPEKLRALPRGSALLLTTGCRPAMVSLTPWYAGPRAQEVSQAVEEAQRGLTSRASAGGMWS